MFRRKPKIVQISATCTDQFFFTVGLDNKGNVWLWDKVKGLWVPHRVEAPNEQA